MKNKLLDYIDEKITKYNEDKKLLECKLFEPYLEKPFIEAFKNYTQLEAKILLLEDIKRDIYNNRL
jgi:hypothetical protein